MTETRHLPLGMDVATVDLDNFEGPLVQLNIWSRLDVGLDKCHHRTPEPGWFRRKDVVRVVIPPNVGSQEEHET